MGGKLKIFIIFIIILILSFMLAQQTGLLYEKTIGQNITSWGDYDAEKYEGFIIIFTFLAALLFLGFLDKNRLNIALVFMLLMPVFNVITGGLEVALISLALGIVGLGLGQIIYLIRTKYSHKKPTT